MPAKRTFSEAGEMPRAMGMRAALEVNARSPLRAASWRAQSNAPVTRTLQYWKAKQFLVIADYPGIAPGAAAERARFARLIYLFEKTRSVEISRVMDSRSRVPPTATKLRRREQHNSQLGCWNSPPGHIQPAV